MAKDTIASLPKPTAYVSWPKEGVKLTGAMGEIRPGTRVRVTLEGVTTGFSMRDSGCSVDLRARRVIVDHLGEAAEDDDGEPMTETIEKMKRGRRY